LEIRKIKLSAHFPELSFGRPQLKLIPKSGQSSMKLLLNEREKKVAKSYFKLKDLFLKKHSKIVLL